MGKKKSRKTVDSDSDMGLDINMEDNIVHVRLLCCLNIQFHSRNIII